MKKSLISTLIAAVCLTASGIAMAADNEAVQTGTVTTTVTGVSNVTITLTDTPETVTTEQVKVKGTRLASLGIEATGLDLSSVSGGNIAVAVESSNYDSASGAWLFKTDDGNSTIKAQPRAAEGWYQNPANRVSYRLQSGDKNVNLQLPIEANSGNTNVSAGVYTMPLTVSYNTW